MTQKTQLGSPLRAARLPGPRVVVTESVDVGQNPSPERLVALAEHVITLAPADVHGRRPLFAGGATAQRGAATRTPTVNMREGTAGASGRLHALAPTREADIVWPSPLEPSPFITGIATRIFTSTAEAPTHFQALRCIPALQQPAFPHRGVREHGRFG